MIETIKSKIKQHHELYSLPVIAEYWEELLHKSFEQLGHSTEWKPDRSHSVGKDIIHGEHGRISCKSGIFNYKKKTLTLNGSRTTQYKTIEEKIKFLSDNKDDTYYCLAKIKKDWEDGLKRYFLFIFDSNILNWNEQKWEETKSGWKCENDIFSATISKSMSDQLWIKLNTNFLPEPIIITIDE